MEGIKIYQEERPWGNFRKFIENTKATVKIITVNPNESLSLQSHTKRSEFWRIVKGQGVVEIDGIMREAKEGDEFEIAIGAKHRVKSGEKGMIFLEIALGEFDETGDIMRYEDKYGRA